MTKPYFDQLQTTLKTEDAVCLAPLTCILGEEGTYKSALGDSLVLALTNRHHAYHQPASLLKLAADSTSGIEICLSGTDVGVTWTLPVGADGKAKKPKQVCTGVLGDLSEDELYCVVPTLALRDLLDSAKGEKTRREAYLRRFGQLQNLSCPEGLLADEEQVWTSAVEAVRAKLGKGALNEDVLASLAEHFRSEVIKLRNEIKNLEGAYNIRKAADVEASAGAELIPQYEREISYLEAKLRVESRIVEEAQLTKQLQDASAQTAALALELESLESALRNATDAENAAASALEQEIEKLGSAKANVRVYGARIEQGRTGCPYCTNAEADLQGALETFQARVAERQSQIEALRAEKVRCESARKEVEQELHKIQFRISANNSRIQGAHSSLEGSQSARKQDESTIVGFKAPLSGMSVDQLRTKIQQLKQASALKVALLSEQKRIREAQRRYTLLQSMEKEAYKLQKTCMEAVSQVASAEVSAYLTGGRKAHFDPQTYLWSVSDASGNMREWGTLCGTEETGLMLALACAWTRGSPFRLAVFDDKQLVGLSKKGMRDFFSACEAAYDAGEFNQIVIIWNRPEEVPSRWRQVLSKGSRGPANEI